MHNPESHVKIGEIIESMEGYLTPGLIAKDRFVDLVNLAKQVSFPTNCLMEFDLSCADNNSLCLPVVEPDGSASMILGDHRIGAIDNALARSVEFEIVKKLCMDTEVIDKFFPMWLEWDIPKNLKPSPPLSFYLTLKKISNYAELRIWLQQQFRFIVRNDSVDDYLPGLQCCYDNLKSDVSIIGLGAMLGREQNRIRIVLSEMPPSTALKYLLSCGVEIDDRVRQTITLFERYHRKVGLFLDIFSDQIKVSGVDVLGYTSTELDPFIHILVNEFIAESTRAREICDRLDGWQGLVTVDAHMVLCQVSHLKLNFYDYESPRLKVYLNLIRK